MANVLILGGGFGGVVAAERLAKTLGGEHQITLVSRNKEFVFYPALVRLAFGLCAPEDVSFDLSSAMLDRRIRFVQGEVTRLGITDSHGYVLVDKALRVAGVEGMYAAGDAVSFGGPKMGHMAVRQGEVAAANVAAEIEGRAPEAEYDHEMRFVIDEGGRDSIYMQKKLWADEPASVRQGRFWSWAKRVHEKYWQQQHA